ncbi:MAG: S8 family serine peptidase [Acidobacteriota bacterium]|nr:S8 family serine peptidase [Acidobacteriota bacterium]
MKRLTLLLTLTVCAVLLATASVYVQERLRPQLGDREDAPQRITDPENLPVTFLNQNRLHKLIINNDQQNVYDDLAGRGAIREEVNYGSFRLVVVDQEAIGGRAAMQALPVAARDEQNLIVLNGYVLDTSNAEPLSKEPPADLRQTQMAVARKNFSRPGNGLYVVQFIGPIQDEWLTELNRTGADVISYVPNNAYVVRAGSDEAMRLIQLKDEQSFVQWVGDYEPAFRVRQSLVAARAFDADQFVNVTVQFIASEDTKRKVGELKRTARRFISEAQVLKYHNVTMNIPLSQVMELASQDNVFSIEPAGERRRLDEAQGQISAGNLTGNAPTGPGYLAWLGTKGFTSSQFTGFAVNVVDDAYTLTGHPDLATGRVAFQNNPTNQTGAQGGHGFLNSHIIGGLNTGTGSANEDSLGFNYGLGIVPWARVGVTAIFGSGSSSPATWESTAYGSGSRISSNSWGFQTSTGAPIPDYDSNSQSYDAIVRDAQTGTAGLQQLTVVFAAGNDGSGSNTVSTPSTAKNVITVGAGENVRQTGTDGCGIGNTGANSANDIISFSSRGPVNSAGGDGRVKPDIIAPGTHIQAGVPQSNYNGSSVCNQYWPSGQTLYGWSSGTSHSCPAVAGGAALVYQDFLNKGLSAPSPAMVKATLMNSAAYMNGTGANDTLPSNNQGMGRMDLGRAFDTAARIRVDQTQVLGATGATHQVTGSVASSSQPFRVTLAWTDAPGPTTGAPWVNNLDLEVTVGGVTYRGNVFSGANSTSGGTADGKNNVESVFLPAGATGNFTVTVRATNIAGDGVPGNADTTDQDFALVIYNANTSTSTSPTIGVSPTSLSFTATTGGSNPANKTISITNTGTGTLNWTQTDNASWLTVTPASGTAPSTLTASVNISGLAAGTYNGAITVSATGATNTPVSIPVTLTVSSAGGSQLIVNGGFEGSASPWTLTGGAVWSTGGNARTGTGYLILGGANNTSRTAYQTITIPSGTSPGLNFYLNVTSSETTTTTQFDRLFVEVRNTSGTLLSTLATFSNLNKVTSANSYTLRGAYNLSAFAGQTVRIQFRGTTDSSLITSFRIDDVSVQ